MVMSNLCLLNPQVFGFFLSDAAPVQSPDAAYFTAAALLAVPFIMLLRRKET